jgi:hypothetical protein
LCFFLSVSISLSISFPFYANLHLLSLFLSVSLFPCLHSITTSFLSLSVFSLLFSLSLRFCLCLHTSHHSSIFSSLSLTHTHAHAHTHTHTHAHTHIDSYLRLTQRRNYHHCLAFLLSLYSSTTSTFDILNQYQITMIRHQLIFSERNSTEPNALLKIRNLDYFLFVSLLLETLQRFNNVSRTL